MEPLKKRVVRYWSRRAEDFREQRLREFADAKHDRWLEEFHRYLPKDRQLCVLDLGCGTGYFSLLLAQKGHYVTGIDLTEEMIRGAERSAQELRIEAAFAVMDAECPDFPAHSFDALVTRNLTWTLPHQSEAFRNWCNLLKPDGVLVNFDADYCRTDRIEELRRAHRQVNPELLDENERITVEMSAFQKERPQWDVGLLLSAGFQRVCVDTGVWKRIYAERDEFYNPVPVFAIAAYPT